MGVTPRGSTVAGTAAVRQFLGPKGVTPPAACIRSGEPAVVAHHILEGQSAVEIPAVSPC